MVLLQAEDYVEFEDNNLENNALFTLHKIKKYTNEDIEDNQDKTVRNVGGSMFPKLK